jgi:inhibitor of KinA sporulation pathway (predicted exonuclease)
MPFDYLAVLDFEATCWDNSNYHEIIEFPTVIVDVKTRKIVDRIEQFVRPTVRPFCHKLTTITQAQVDGDVSLAEALKAHEKYPNSIFVTCGDWDLKTMLPQDAARNKLKVPPLYRPLH